MEMTSNIFQVTNELGKTYYVIFKEHLNFEKAEEKIHDDISNVTGIKMLNGDIVYI